MTANDDSPLGLAPRDRPDDFYLRPVGIEGSGPSGPVRNRVENSVNRSEYRVSDSPHVNMPCGCVIRGRRPSTPDTNEEPMIAAEKFTAGPNTCDERCAWPHEHVEKLAQMMVFATPPVPAGLVIEDVREILPGNPTQ